jgi:hypothetical protein
LVNHKRNHELKPGIVPPPPASPDENDRLARAFNLDCANPNSLANLNRYKNSIERSIDRGLRQLEKYRAARTAATRHEWQAVPPDEGAHAADPVHAAEAAPSAATPREAAATASKIANYHLNPKNEGNRQVRSAHPLTRPSAAHRITGFAANRAPGKSHPCQPDNP